MTTPSTISLGGSTVVAPTLVQPYANQTVTRLVPLDGGTIVQVSANADSTGDKNTVRKMIWDAIPGSDTRWTHTIATLKALEGTESTVDMDSLFGGPYTFSTSILIHEVIVEDLGYDFVSSREIYRVEINFTHV